MTAALLPVTAFIHVFAPLVGNRVGVVFSPGGNAGDRLIELATCQLLTDYGVEYRLIPDCNWSDCDVLVCGGGGNFGHPYCWPEMERRRQALRSGMPCILLPQTAYGSEWGWDKHRVFVREAGSLRYYPDGVIAPDLALGLRPSFPIPLPTEKRGRFFSRAPEGLWHQLHQMGDPRYLHEKSPETYIAYAAKFEEIVTDCLHMAISGLIARRQVHLVPTALHKQRSMWETWLRHFGCQWSDNPDVI